MDASNSEMRDARTVILIYFGAFMTVAYIIGHGVAERKGTRQAIEICAAVLEVHSENYSMETATEFCRNFVRWDKEMEQ